MRKPIYLLKWLLVVWIPLLLAAGCSSDQASKKLVKKTYFRHSGYQGGTTFTPAGQMLARFPERVVEHAVKGMLPHNRLGAQMFRKLSVYAGPEHPHAAQKPEKLELNIR